MFPLAQTPSLRYKVLQLAPTPHPRPTYPSSACRKWGWTVSLWVPLQVIYFNGEFLSFIFLPFFFHGNPRFPQKKCHVQSSDCKGGGGRGSPTHTPHYSSDLPSSPKQKLLRGIQLVHLTFGTLPAACSAAAEPSSLLAEDERVRKGTVSEAIDYEPQTDIRETSGLH